MAKRPGAGGAPVCDGGGLREQVDNRVWRGRRYVVGGYRCGLPKYALFSERDGSQGFTPEFAKRNPIGCQMPLCSDSDTD
jgi:hypothetical protein